MNLSELMIHIKESPGKFLQDDCIFQLRAFIRGFIFAKNSSVKSVTDDHNLLDSIDMKIKRKCGMTSNERVSIEEVLSDNEGDKAFHKYIELWFQYAQH